MQHDGNRIDKYARSVQRRRHGRSRERTSQHRPVSRTAGGAAERHALHDAIEGKPWSGEIHGTDWLKTNLLPMQVKGLTAMLNQKATP